MTENKTIEVANQSIAGPFLDSDDTLSGKTFLQPLYILLAGRHVHDPTQRSASSPNLFLSVQFEMQPGSGKWSEHFIDRIALGMKLVQLACN